MQEHVLALVRAAMAEAQISSKDLQGIAYTKVGIPWISAASYLHVWKNMAQDIVLGLMLQCYKYLKEAMA